MVRVSRAHTCIGSHFVPCAVCERVYLPVLDLASTGRARVRIKSSMSQKKREIVEVIQLVLVARIKGRVADQMVPLAMEEVMAVVQEEEEKLVPQERVQQQTVLHAPVPQILEETVEVVRFVQRERVQQRTAKKIVDVPPFAEETLEMMRWAPKERVRWIDEQMVEVFCGKEEWNMSQECCLHLGEQIGVLMRKDAGRAAGTGPLAFFWPPLLPCVLGVEGFFLLGIVVWKRAQNRHVSSNVGHFMMTSAPPLPSPSSPRLKQQVFPHCTRTHIHVGDSTSVHHKLIFFKSQVFTSTLRAKWFAPQRKFSPSRHEHQDDRRGVFFFFSRSTEMADRIVPLKDTA